MSWGAIASFFAICFFIGLVIVVALVPLGRKKGKRSVLEKVGVAVGVAVIFSILLLVAIINGWITFYSE
ncbi:hypothetical protein SAMN04488121_102709 [Chitinophaga filiformis]|uniref:Uncharacterized protein n=2 Tax=Chitinophaga filiformis TaxID=104663 RepID=A0A1G7NAQ8_CHIFI|nr:hypothetical protein SAMN04488121_102709 [Chitinophaga filiformis]